RDPGRKPLSRTRVSTGCAEHRGSRRQHRNALTSGNAPQRSRHRRRSREQNRRVSSYRQNRFPRRFKKRSSSRPGQACGNSQCRPKTAKEIYDRFRIETIEDLEALCKTDKLLGVPGFKKKTIDNMLRGIDLYRKRKGNYLLGRTVPIAKQLCKYLEGFADRVAYGGSLRRMK